MYKICFELDCFEDFTSLNNFQSYRDLEAGEISEIEVARPGFEPGPLGPQAKSLTNTPLLLPLKICKLI